MKDYIAGFFDGDGCMSVQIQNRKQGTIGIHPQAIINLRYITGFFDAEGCLNCHYGDRNNNRKHFKCSAGMYNDDHTTLKEIGWYLKTVNIKSTLCKNRLVIAGIENSANFYRLIIPYSRVKHRQIVIFLDKIYPLLTTQKGWKRQKFDKLTILRIMRAVDEMNALKGKRGNNKYTANYFRRRWHFKQRKNEPDFRPKKKFD